MLLGERIPNLGTSLAILLVGVSYYIGALFGFALTFHPLPISTLWPPNSILMAAFLLTPVRFWWLVVAAAFPAHLAAELQSGVPALMVLSWFVTNCTEALIGAVLISRFIEGMLRFDSVRHVGVFLLFGVFVAPFLSSFLDVAFVRLIEPGQASYWQLWHFRLFSNMLAAVILVPVIVSWQVLGLTPLQRAPWGRYVEASLLMLGLLVVNMALFMDNTMSNTTPVLLYTPMPFFIWAAVRFGPAGVSTALLSVASLALWETVHSQGPFATSSPAESALTIQLFLIVVSIPLLILAAAIEEDAAAKRALSRSEERLRLAMTAAQIGTWDWHIATDRVTWSDISRRIFGATSDEKDPVRFETVASRIHAQDRADVLRAVDKAVAGDEVLEESFRIVRPGGEIRWIRSKGQVFHDEVGRPVRMIGVSLDVTEQRALEFELAQQREQLTYLNRVATLGELSGALAHELNQPLTAILANAQTGRRLMEQKPLDTKELGEILDDIVFDVDRASEIIRRLYDLFKRSAPHFESLDINQLVRDVLVLAHTDFQLRNIDADVDLGSDVPAVKGDRIQLQQVLLNLIVNGCEAMSDSPPELRKLLICTHTFDPQSVRIAVADHGPGVSTDRSEEMFDAFFTTKEQGLGLGLSICRSIVLAHGGCLWAANNKNGGATFNVDLPRMIEQKAQL